MRERESALPNFMSFSAIKRPSDRAASMWAGLEPALAPQKTQTTGLLSCVILGCYCSICIVCAVLSMVKWWMVSAVDE